MGEMAIKKKLIAATVSSGETGLKRREEGKTTSSQRQTATQGNLQTNRNISEGGGRDKLKNVDGDFPACMRLNKEIIEDNAKKTKAWKEDEEGRLKYNNVDGDMPLSEKNWKEKQRRQQQQRKWKIKTIKAEWWAEAKICVELPQERETLKKLQTTMLHLSCYRRIRDQCSQVHELRTRFCELEGCRWDALILCETWRHDKEEIWETHRKHICMGAGKYDNKTRSGSKE